MAVQTTGGPGARAGIVAPGLAPDGWQLLTGDDRPVAQFMYQNDAGKRLTLCLVPLATAKPAAGESAFRFECFGNVNVFYWREEGCGYALSGDVRREEFLPLARSAYDELNQPATKGG